MIAELQLGGRNPEELSQLLQLDCLATWIRRNSERPLVLAGAENSTTRRGTTFLRTVERAAASEINDHQHVTFREFPDF
ncbi:hypothetical protein [Streptomyces sp. x-19]|uniref:hypothetical protein n=1 Tax=Streptomyces sp. x-19 TaxID=2789280 RepID=UPI00398130DC